MNLAHPFRVIPFRHAALAAALAFPLGLGAGCVNPNAAPAASAGTTAAADEPPPPPPKKDEPGPPVVPRKKGENVFAGVKWWQDPYSNAHLAMLRLKQNNPAESALMAKIADNGGADWIGDWTPNVENWVRKRVTLINKNKAFPLFIAYNIPKRDCGQYSAGGASKTDQYKAWITAFANGIGERRAAVVLEPDSLGLLKKCLSDADQKERLELIRFAIRAFEDKKNTAVYLDAGNSGWIPAPEMAERLKAAGIDEADGFALNVSNYKTTESSIKYGREISKRLGGKHFVVDTSRNGNGPPDVEGDVEAAWCNPAGRALGAPPTTNTGDPLVDAFLWLKKPGESDGECNGGPKAGNWWQERALELARNAKF
jgi:endoglucanase